jgi:signal transduction histidine kinase
MRIGQRLLLAVAPGIVGVFAVAALAYWGERSRHVPGVLLAVVAIVTLLSLWFAWDTTRDLARRIERIGHRVEGRGTHAEPGDRSLLVSLARETIARLSGSGRAAPDELDAIEKIVARMDGELSAVEARERAMNERMEAHRAESARLLFDAGDRIARRMEEVRMPLHVLLDTPFGELNENQEELIGAARSAADAANAEARKVRELASLELSKGARLDRVSPGEVLRALVPMIEAEARRAKVRVQWDLAPALPAVSGDRARLQEAIREVLVVVVRSAVPETTIEIVAAQAAGGVEIRVAPVGSVSAAELAIERRVIEALGAHLDVSAARAVILIPFWNRP